MRLFHHISSHHQRQSERVIDELAALVRYADVRGNIRLLGEIALAIFSQRAIKLLALAIERVFALARIQFGFFDILTIAACCDFFDFGR